MRINQEMLYDWLRKVRDVRVRLRGIWIQNANRRSLAMLSAVLIPITLIYIIFLGPPSNFPTESIITIEKGATLSEVSEQLKEEKIVRIGILLRALVSISNGDKSVVAGDYQFSSPANVFSVARTITSGAFGLVPLHIRIPEGASVEEMSILYGNRLKRFDADAFIKQAKPVEGYLFPDTYFFLSNADEQIVVRAMLSNFELRVAEIQEEIDAFGRPLSDIVIMASIIEKEASIFEDRRKISGLLWRRISIGMPLQVDAAFLYFLGRTTFDLTLKDLQTDSPYNTYKYKGLPPGPITNPGLSAIKAAVTPIDTGTIFYLADNNGVTHFSKTYEEHLSKKRLYLDN